MCGFTAASCSVTTERLVKYWIVAGGRLGGDFGTKLDLRYLRGCSITFLRSTLVGYLTGASWCLFCAIIHSTNGTNRHSIPMVVTCADIR